MGIVPTDYAQHRGTENTEVMEKTKSTVGEYPAVGMSPVPRMAGQPRFSQLFSPFSVFSVFSVPPCRV